MLSRYPIRELRVPSGASFMNVAARIAVSSTQDVWVMSNWYGMKQFAEVYDFHKERFGETGEDTPCSLVETSTPCLPAMGGAARLQRRCWLRGLRTRSGVSTPDVARFPGVTHRGGKRIDQLFFKGESHRHESTRVIKDWPTGFPSDH